MSAPRFVLVGYASEFALRPLARLLSERGLEAVTADLACVGLDGVVLPAGDGPLVLVSSQHFAMSGLAFDRHLGVTTNCAPPQALREQIGAELLVFVPHDLLDVLLTAEVPVLSAFDLFAAPDGDFWWAAAHVPTVNTGWVGHALEPGVPPAGTPLDRGVLFTTADQWIHQQGGGEFLLRALEHTLASGIAVRMARWPGMETLAQPLRDAGVPLIDPDIPAGTLIAHAPLVVTNAPSSVLAEATLVGHRPMCVLDPSGDKWFAGRLDALDVVTCRDSEFAALAGDAGRIEHRSPGFDLDALLEAVDVELARRSSRWATGSPTR
jgi:hypothetical protein